jgi:single-strand DNA-binding protein
MSMNITALEGRLTKDPEVRYTQNNNTAVAKFTLAVNRMFKQEGQPEADFIPIVVFGKTAENCGKYIGKGRLVSVVGRIQTRNWDDTEGTRHYATEVIASEVHFLDKAKDSGSAAGSNNSTNNSQGSGDFYPADEEDDLPF